jgi:hypothetical protein
MKYAYAGPSRYPRATRKLSETDIKRLDYLFHCLNRMSRDHELWEAYETETERLLYGRD